MRLPVTDPVSMDPTGKPLVVARGSLPMRAGPQGRRQRVREDQPAALDRKLNVLGREVSVIDRGRERFEIHCAICHGYTGQGGNDAETGHGLVGRRWPVNDPELPLPDRRRRRQPRRQLMADGEYFEVITNGKGTMPAYGARISPEDRWAIVHYLRALQP
jgi:mono/diheme cytochrome c family protein